MIKTMRVLVCDDERHIVRLFQVNLERQGHVVTCAHGGREAIEILKRERFDLVVLDPEMPDLSGYEVRDWITANDGVNETRVVMLQPKTKSNQHRPW